MTLMNVPPKNLCQAATNLKGGNTSWSTNSSKAKHVTLALSLGMSCGVVAIVDPCDLDPNECKISKLCEKATKSNNGQTVWNSAAQNYVDVAKEYELTCDVKTENAAAKKRCNDKPEVCPLEALCYRATTGSGGSKIWATGSYASAFAKEAKKRGLTCGVKTKTAAVTKTCSVETPEACKAKILCTRATEVYRYSRVWLTPYYSYVKEAIKRGLTCGVGEATTTTCSRETPEACSASALCKAASYTSGNSRLWFGGQRQAYVKEAKKRGLTCGVGKSVASKTAPLFRKSDFLALNSTRRKQLQYGLKKLGYYTSSIDGAYGPNTQRAVRGYATAKGITSGYPASVYNRIVGEVNVPSSFAVAKRPSTSSSSSSSASSSSSGPSLGGMLLGGAATILVCSLTPNAAACLDGAMGNSSNGGSSTSSSNNSSKPVSSSCNSNYDCAYSSVCIKKAGRGQCMELPRGTSRSNFNAIKCSGSYDCPSRSKCDRTYKICVER